MNRGGQNFVEPMAFGKPVVTGPHLSNFQDLLPVFDDCLTIVENARELRFVLEAFLESPAAFQETGERGRQRLELQGKALDHVMGVLA